MDEELEFWTILEQISKVAHNLLKRKHLTVAELSTIDPWDLYDLRLIGNTRLVAIYFALEQAGISSSLQDLILESDLLSAEYDRIRSEYYGGTEVHHM